MAKFKNPDIPHEAVLAALDYDIGTGIFVWKIGPRKGQIAGCAAKAQMSIWLFTRSVLVHRLAWFYVHGRWPTSDLDHINGNPLDNRICNLREATRSQNNWNAGLAKHNTSGVKGVCWRMDRNRWLAHLTVSGKQISRYHKTFEEAVEARKQLELIHHGEFRRKDN